MTDRTDTHPRRLGILAATIGLLVSLALPATSMAAPKAPDTVTISGRAYEFNHMDRFVAGATIRVRELPNATATTDVNGDYELVVPNDTTVTPYIDPPAGYNEIDLQTFHTRGEPIVNANFQTPADQEYNALAIVLSVPIAANGRPEQCAIVTTASARNVRGVDYVTFEERTPHGVPGATASGQPALPPAVYFNEFVIPDPSEPATSEDGGIIWTSVPAGAYRISTVSPTATFASFLATCEPGRIVNANPPWGAYQLAEYESPLPAGVAAGSVTKLSASKKKVKAKIDAGEQLDVKLVIRRGAKKVGRRTETVPVGKSTVRIPVKKKYAGKRVKVKATFTDAAGDSASSAGKVRLGG